MKSLVESNKLIVVMVILILTAISWSKVMDTRSTEYVDRALVQSTGAFASARVLNAVISTLQSTQVSFALGGGVSVTVGEVLDPLNDLVEQYSSLMKVSIVSLIIQKLLIEITSDNFFKIAITLTGVLLIASLCMRTLAIQEWLLRVFATLLFLRFILVLTVLANGWFDNAFLYDRTEKDMSALTTLADEHAITSGAPSLTEERSEELAHQYDLNVTTLTALEQARDSLTETKRRLENEITSIDSEFAEARGQAEMLDRLLRRDEQLRTIEERKEVRSIHLRATENQLRVINQQHDRLQQHNITINLELQGLPSNWLGRVERRFTDGRTAVASAADLVRIQTIKKKLDDSVQGILRLMAKFIFKTLISPLLFMLALMWGAKHIWNVNLNHMLKNELRLRSGTSTA